MLRIDKTFVLIDFAFLLILHSPPLPGGNKFLRKKQSEGMSNLPTPGG